ncbi:MAG: hypothetical protein MMC33_003207 [Icmadophila ericetorum]|nr:hypothetical protein [Icmadophila ericetorum]
MENSLKSSDSPTNTSTTSTSNSNGNGNSNKNKKLPKAYSCVLCFKRKVKCDKHYPCAACLRAKVDCIFRIPAPPRRRRHARSTAADEAILARLKHYEDLLRANGIEFNSSSPPSSTTASKTDTRSPPPTPPQDANHSITNPNPASTHRMPTDFSQGKLIVDHGRSRFIENKLWTTVSEESRHNKDIIPDSDSEDEMDTPADDSTDFVLATTSSPNQTYVLHPSPDQILKLWQIFLTNVNPLTKIVHQPTLQQSIESIADIEHLPRGLEALMFAIYGAAVLSMRDGECQATFGESRSTLQSRYSLGARRSLTRARFMRSSDIMVLQALVIYLLTMRQDLDSRTLWTLSGVATRIAQGMGVHRDGTVLGLPPFETEMRRRLWWQINLLDFNATELSGFGAREEFSWWNTKSPSNVNDVDIWPDMKEPPVEKTGATEMIACLLGYEVCIFWQTKLVQMGMAGQDFTRAVRRWVDTATKPEKDAWIDEFESSLEEKFLKYCDPSEPLHMMASMMARITCKIKSMQIKAHRPRRYANKRDIPDSERQFLWTTSMSLIEADNMAHSYRSLQKFKWHTDVNFQWHALIYALGELIARPIGESKDDAWAQIEGIFKNHPNFISDHKRPLHIAIASMCLKAWRSRHKAQIENPQGSSWLDTPPFILQLQKQREAEETKVNAKWSEASKLNPRIQAEYTHLMAQPTDTSIVPKMSGQQLQPDNTFDSSLSPNFSMPMMDDMAINWQTWDTLLNDFEIPCMPPSMNHHVQF